jgi:hypothetical protein
MDGNGGLLSPNFMRTYKNYVSRAPLEVLHGIHGSSPQIKIFANFRCGGVKAFGWKK